MEIEVIIKVSKRDGSVLTRTYPFEQVHDLPPEALIADLVGGDGE